MNKVILSSEIQKYISSHLAIDVHKLAMAKSPFHDVSSAELAAQISGKNKCVKKLPGWYNHDFIYYPPLLSIEQCSSEITAKYKSSLAAGDHLIDLTGGFGVDCYYFSKKIRSVTHCELNPELSAIAAHNAGIMQCSNIHFFATDGLEYLKKSAENFDTIYIDPARRGTSGKVFMLKDCTPNVVSNLDLLFTKAQQIIIKTAPLLDITAGLKELRQVSEIHIVSVKNECKELLWILDRDMPDGKQIKMTAVTLNETTKTFSFFRDDEELQATDYASVKGYLYEPDTALLKSGSFNLIAARYDLKKLDSQTHLYVSTAINNSFPGRIFKINSISRPSELKKRKDLKGNVVVRNYPDKAELLVKKYKVKPDDYKFLIFTRSKKDGTLVVEAEIIQHY